MALMQASLASDLVDLYNFVATADPPPTAEELAAKWVDAFSSYMVGISNPAAPPTAVEAGKAAMQALLEKTIMEPPPAGLVALTASLMAFCVAFAALTVPYVSMPPPSPMPPPPPTPAPSELAAAAMALTIHTWVITGLASVPPAPPAPWA